ncbi:MAG: endonuclease/exonuclease/phosphatase family protein, partial [Rubripirellula sp.]
MPPQASESDSDEGSKPTKSWLRDVLRLAIVLCVVWLACVFWFRRSNRQTKRPQPNPSALIEVGTTAPTPVQVATLNAHFLPGIANRVAGKRSSSQYRAAAIAIRLREYDIVCLNEAFDEKLACGLIDEFNADPARQFAFVRSPEPLGWTKMVSGGLILFSRYPVIDSGSITYTNGSRFIATGFRAADGWSAKGALHVRLALQSGSSGDLDCFVTHLESHSAKIRAEQTSELIEFIRSKHDPRIPLLIMGDFNIVGPQRSGKTSDPVNANPEYMSLLSALQGIDGGIRDVGVDGSGTSAPMRQGGGKRIDYILASRADVVSTETLLLLDERVPEGSLSDHAG